MSCYLDTGILLKLYCLEEETPSVIKLVEHLQDAVVFHELHQLELKNSLYRKYLRKEISQKELTESLKLIEADLTSNYLSLVDVPWSQVWPQAQQLNAKYVLTTNCRSLDLLHVAIAVELKAKHFVSTDAKQLQMAKKAGLKILTF